MTRPHTGFVGNDVVDLRSPLLAARAEEGATVQREWEARHLTEKERALPGASRTFWEIFAVKEAASKAFAQAGVAVTPGAFRDFEVDLAGRSVTHAPTGLRGAIALLEATADSVHAAVVHPEDAGGSRLAAAAEILAPGASPSSAAREILAVLLARASGGSRPDRYAVSFENGIPRVLDSGQRRDWSVSLAHAGRFVAACALLP